MPTDALSYIGFLDNGEDIEDAIKSVGSISGYSTLAGIYSEWHPLLYKITSHLGGSGSNGRNFVRQFAQTKIAKHKEQKVDLELSQEPFMTKMIRAHRQDPDKVGDHHLFMMAQSNVIAGFDTTAISLSATIYFLMKNPRVLEKLRLEIDNATQNGSPGEYYNDDKMSFKQSQGLPYLQAVIKESLRMHSATGLPLWRVVPEGGVELEGLHFPEGTIVGTNSWVVHYDPDIFTNPNEFMPERWLDEDEAKLRTMNEMFMPVSYIETIITCERVNMHILIKPWLVRTRRTHLYWKTHICVGDGQVDPGACSRVRF
jgi:hypothetical protein